MATKAEIVQEAAKLIKAKLAELDTAEQTLLMGGKFTSVGGMQYSQENLPALREERRRLAQSAITLSRKGV